MSDAHDLTLQLALGVSFRIVFRPEQRVGETIAINFCGLLFADFDELGIGADERTLRQEDFAKGMEVWKFRPMQFCIFLKHSISICSCA